MKKVDTDLLQCLVLLAYTHPTYTCTGAKFMIGAAVDTLRIHPFVMGNASGSSLGADQSHSTYLSQATSNYVTVN